MNNYSQTNNRNYHNPYSMPNNASYSNSFPTTSCGAESKRLESCAPCKEAHDSETPCAKPSPTPCSGMEDGLQGYPLAMSYVPWQMFRKLYEPCEAFHRGTIFQELEFDFYGRRCN